MCACQCLLSTAYPDIANRVKEDEDRTKENPSEKSMTRSKGEEMLDDAIVRMKMMMNDEMALLLLPFCPMWVTEEKNDRILLILVSI